ncbi:MAG: DUF1254 domain-containing protein [Symploca sp. SIO1B1]|nr:DUF1254 domain-containing protein [Symploca sp. SIO1B1]
MKQQILADNNTYGIGIQAYIYAYPMILMEITRRLLTNVEASTDELVPMNQFGHRRHFPDQTSKAVVRPNADTLYSVAWFDVSQEPLVLSVSDTNGRYYMLQIIDMWTDTFAVPGSRTLITKAVNYAIISPKWQGKLPDGFEPIYSPTTVGCINGRTQTNNVADYENVHQIQDGYKVTPLSQWGKSYTPPTKVAVNPAWDMKTPARVQIANMSAGSYFELFATLLKDNPPHQIDWNIVKQLEQIGIVPGQDFEFSKLDSTARQMLEKALVDSPKIIANQGERFGENINGWQIAREGMGSYGISYLRRAYVALIGLGATVPEDIIYPISVIDGDGNPYHGSHRYVLHFDRDRLPPVNAFWSLTMYDSSGYFIENPLNRYCIGDRDPLKFNSDGSLDIYIQHDSTGKTQESNWLPAPADEFNLTIRLYWPKTEILSGEWNPPPVKRVK